MLSPSTSSVSSLPVPSSKGWGFIISSFIMIMVLSQPSTTSIDELLQSTKAASSSSGSDKDPFTGDETLSTSGHGENHSAGGPSASTGDIDKELQQEWNDFVAHPLILPACSQWFSGGPIDICVVGTRGYPHVEHMDVVIKIQGKQVYRTQLGYTRPYQIFNVTHNNIRVDGILEYRGSNHYGLTGQGLWGDIHYNEVTPNRLRYEGELVSLDPRPVPHHSGKWWGIFNVRWRVQQTGIAIYSFRSSMLTAKHWLSGSGVHTIPVEFVWGHDNMFVKGHYKFDSYRRQLTAELDICPTASRCQHFSGVIASW